MPDFYAACVMLLACSCLIVAASAQAQRPARLSLEPQAGDEEADNQTVDVDISIVSTKAVLTEAKKEALSRARSQAFFKALLRLAPKQARDLYRQVRGENLARYVESFTIQQESKRAGMYRADVTYRFDRSRLKRLIGVDRGIQPSQDGELQGKGLLIVAPYDKGDDGFLLFSQENRWRQAMAQAALQAGRGALVLPFGDPQDAFLLDDKVVLSADAGAFRKLARRYGTRNVAIAFARIGADEAGMPVLEVTLRRAGDGAADEKVLRYRARQAGAASTALLERAAADVAARLYEGMNDYSLFSAPEAETVPPLHVEARYRHGREWRRLNRALRTLPDVEKVQLRRFSSTYARLVLTHDSSPAALKRILTQRGVQVETGEKPNHLRLYLP